MLVIHCLEFLKAMSCLKVTDSCWHFEIAPGLLWIPWSVSDMSFNILCILSYFVLDEFNISHLISNVSANVGCGSVVNSFCFLTYAAEICPLEAFSCHLDRFWQTSSMFADLIFDLRLFASISQLRYLRINTIAQISNSLFQSDEADARNDQTSQYPTHLHSGVVGLGMIPIAFHVSRTWWNIRTQVHGIIKITEKKSESNK